MKTVNLETLIKELQNEVNKGNKTLSFKGVFGKILNDMLIYLYIVKIQSTLHYNTLISLVSELQITVDLT